MDRSVNNQKTKKIVIIGIIIFLAFQVINLLSDHAGKNQQFAGIIQKLTFNEKKTPTVIINGKEYGIHFTNWVFNEKLRQGDSLIKKKDSKIYTLIKLNTGKIIVSE